MRINVIAAVAKNLGIGLDNKLLYWLPNDLNRFKSLTTVHTIIMGRKTFDSLPKGALPGRLNVVVTRNEDFAAPDVVVCHSIDEALDVTAKAEKRFVIGGAQLYAATIDRVDELHLTLLHATFPEADAFFPAINPGQWHEVSREEHKADERNQFDYTFVTLRRVGK